MKLESVVSGLGSQPGRTPSGRPTIIHTPRAAATGVSSRPRGDGFSGSEASQRPMAGPSSVTATPIRRYRERYQNGRMRAFQRRPWGARMKSAPAMVAMPMKNSPVRRRLMTLTTAPPAASSSTHRMSSGNRFLLYSVSFSQPMLLAYGSRKANGTDQKAASSAPTAKTAPTKPRRRLPGRSRYSTQPPTTAKIVGSRWLKPVRARTTPASTRCLPVSRPRATSPRKTRANDRLIEKENSPASVDAMFPP